MVKAKKFIEYDTDIKMDMLTPGGYVMLTQ